MSMQPQTQQPAEIYPNTLTRPPHSPSSSHSNGSFGTVFIVLAVIIVISGIACCLGRLCNRRLHKEKQPKRSRGKERPDPRHLEFEPHKRNHSFRPRERDNDNNRDLEFGFDKNIAASKPVGNGERGGFKQFGNGHGERSFRQFGHGDISFEPKIVPEYGEPKMPL